MKDTNATVLKWLKIMLYFEKKLKCYGCTEKLTGKIFMGGPFTKPYYVCESCHVTRRDLTMTMEISNVYMEQARNKLITIYQGLTPPAEMALCKYSTSGCIKLMKDKIEDHEKECLYQTRNCMFCSWLGRYVDLHKHLSTEHRELNLKNEILTKDEGDFRVILVRREVFVMCKTTFEPGEIGYTVHHITPKEESEFRFDLMTLGEDDTLNLFTNGSCLAATMDGLRSEEYLKTACAYSGIRVANVANINVLIFPRDSSHNNVSRADL